MRLFAIDPGTSQSAWCIYDGERFIEGDIVRNEDLLFQIVWGEIDADHMAIEMVASYGMPVGREIFETVYWIGRFVEAWDEVSPPRESTRVYRSDVKLHLCQSARAKDANIRQALLDKFPATGGGKIPQVGTKKQPGPLYGCRKDIWAALAVAVFWWETRNQSATSATQPVA